LAALYTRQSVVKPLKDRFSFSEIMATKANIPSPGANPRSEAQTTGDLTLRLVRLTASEQRDFAADAVMLVFPKGGQGKFTAGSNTQMLMPGSVLVVGEGIKGSLCISKDSELIYWFFSLHLEHLFPLFSSAEIPLLESMMEGFKSPRFFPAATPVAKQCHRLIEDVPAQFDLDHRSQLVRVAAVILSDEFKTARQRRTVPMNVEERIEDVFERLSADQLLSLSVGELAVRFGCSRRHLNRLFHQHFGFSVTALRMEMRLLKAISCLRDPNIKIINVAERCGFNHLGLFNTCFKRRFGVSPGEWRKKVANSENPQTLPPIDVTACPLRSKGLCPMTEVAGTVSLQAAQVYPAQKVDGLKALAAMCAPDTNISPIKNRPTTG